MRASPCLGYEAASYPGQPSDDFKRGAAPLVTIGDRRIRPRTLNRSSGRPTRCAVVVEIGFSQWSVRRGVLYLIVAAIGHLMWETAQLPLYTVWWTGTSHENVVAVVHCTGGDVLITTATLLTAALAARLLGWRPFGSAMVFTAIVLGIAYTILSEWLNVEVWRSWSYSSIMPVLPWLGTGLSPVLQWLLVPAMAFALTGVRNGGSQ